MNRWNKMLSALEQLGKLFNLLRLPHVNSLFALSRDLANLYRGVPRAELERIAHEELFGEKEGVA